MGASEIIEIQKQIEEITAVMAALMVSTRFMSRCDTVVQAKLTHVWDVTQDLQRRAAHPAIVQGLCCDALDQVARVFDLITECEGVPNSQQLASIGFAGELMAEKIKIYQQMSRHAAQARAIAEADAKEPA